MEKTNMLLIACIIVSLIGSGLAINNTVKLMDSEWVCIAQECSEFVSGSEWVKQNCNPEGANNEMICRFQYEGAGFVTPLSGIENVSNMVSCKEYTCSSKVLISKTKGDSN